MGPGKIPAGGTRHAEGRACTAISRSLPCYFRSVLRVSPQPVWEILLDIFIILMFYDFFYYVSHRFWFHGQGPMRKIHAVHHQARNPSYLDAHYVHPLETFIGLALYMASIVVLAALLGPFHIATIIPTYRDLHADQPDQSRLSLICPISPTRP